MHIRKLTASKPGRAYNIEAVLEAIVREVPPPTGDRDAALQAMIFDSHYDPYKGVVAYVRVIKGQISPAEILLPMATSVSFRPLEVGVFAPEMRPVGGLVAGEVGYIATGLKSVRECHVGDTITAASRRNRNDRTSRRPRSRVAARLAKLRSSPQRQKQKEGTIKLRALD